MEQFKKAKAVLIPTEKYSNIILNHNNKLQYNDTKYIKSYQQLLIISDDKDDKLNDGEWCLLLENKYVNGGIGKYNTEKAVGYGLHGTEFFKKIIASCPSLEIVSKGINPVYEPIPQLSQQFIEQYIESYNKGEVIIDVLVEYGYFEMSSKANYKGNYDFICPNCKHIDKDLWYSKQPTYCTNCSKLKINPDNTITIKHAKDSWNREEVIELMKKYCIDIHRYTINSTDFNNWIKENL